MAATTSNVDRCVFCGMPNPQYTCSNCHRANYCSEECQLKDWSNGIPPHKFSCSCENPLSRMKYLSMLDEAIADAKGKDFKKTVICASRRTDVPGNQQLLDTFLEQLRGGYAFYPNPLRCGTPVVISVKPSDVYVISWFSKDFVNLINAWNIPETADLLRRYKHHFSFTINGPQHSILEPGVESTLDDRIERQLPALAQICTYELDQNVNHSIVCRIDPIIVYTTPDQPGVEQMNATQDHIARLCKKMYELGLTRMHMSWYQPFQKAERRLARFADRFKIIPLMDNLQKQVEIFEKMVLPHTLKYGIQVETCTAMDLVRYYETHKPFGALKQGPCAGYDDLHSLNRAVLPKLRKAGGNRFCTCVDFRDVGDVTAKCKHGCCYCFENPKLFNTDIENIV